MRTAFIFCGGGPSQVPVVVPDDALVIAADVGLAEAERLGVEVELLVGDMDSVDAGSLGRFERQGGEVRRYPEDKDATDLDLAIEAALVAGVGHVVVVGGGGGRLDHLIANALVMGSPRYAAVEIDGVFGGSRLHICRGRRQLAGSMSGGEQQMLAVARALMSSPRILLVDEPSVGLAPILVSRVIAKIKELKERRALTVLMAEQNFNQATKIADRGYIIVHGKIEFEGRSTQELRENELVKRYYLGV